MDNEKEERKKEEEEEEKKKEKKKKKEKFSACSGPSGDARRPTWHLKHRL